MSNTIWVLVELENGQPTRSSLEVLGKAAQLGSAEAIVLGSNASEVASTLGENVVSATFPKQGTGIVLTRPKAFGLERFEGKTAEVENLSPALNAESQKMQILDRVVVQSEGPALEDASVIVAGGRGLGKAEN